MLEAVAPSMLVKEYTSKTPQRRVISRLLLYDVQYHAAQISPVLGSRGCPGIVEKGQGGLRVHVGTSHVYILRDIPPLR